MSFGCEDKLIDVDDQILGIGEQEEQVLNCLGEHKRVHPILVLASSHIVDCRIAAGDLGVLLESFQSPLANLKIVMITSGAVQEVCGLNEFGP